nr:hypothetical protein [uncultured Oscillibacter sp.]
MTRRQEICHNPAHERPSFRRYFYSFLPFPRVFPPLPEKAAPVSHNLHKIFHKRLLQKVIHTFHRVFHRDVSRSFQVSPVVFRAGKNLHTHSYHPPFGSLVYIKHKLAKISPPLLKTRSGHPDFLLKKGKLPRKKTGRESNHARRADKSAQRE